MLHRRGLSVPFPSRATWWEGRRSIKHERDAGFPYADNADAVTEAVKNKGRRGHGTSARSNAVTAIKTAIVKSLEFCRAAWNRTPSVELLLFHRILLGPSPCVAEN